MAIFGKFGNIFRKVTSTFAFQGRTFRQTWDYLKTLPWKTKPVTAYRQYSESRTFYRLRPFHEKMPQTAHPLKGLITKTGARLKNKYQYIFEVKIASSKGFGFDTQWVSFYDSRAWTKGSAEGIMKDIVMERQNKEKYGFIQALVVKQIGVRQSKMVA